MIRLTFFLLAAWLVFGLVGCGSARTAAPVRESARSKPTVSKPLPPVPSGHYRIQAGDTLFKIAFENSLDYRALAEWNNLVDPDSIRAGDVLRLSPLKPTVSTTALPAAAHVATPPIPGNAALAAEPVDDPPDIWVWPGRGVLLARFGDGLSKGIDIAGSPGQPVQAAASGRVVYAGAGLRGYGKLIIIRHGKTLLSAYAHNRRMLVGEGQNVGRGQTIAEMGDTDAERVKLHFEIREYGKPVDPLNYLPKSS